jgi:hypothetical protein
MATIKERASTRANVTLELKDEKGRLKKYFKVHNTITTVGLNALSSQLLPIPDIAKPGWMELGIGNRGSILLDEYIPNSRLPLSYIGRNNNIITMMAFFTAQFPTITITEAGVFNSGTENTADMLLYTTFRGINKQISDSLLITWEWEVY